MPAPFNSVALARLSGHGSTALFPVNVAVPHSYHLADQRSRYANPHTGENTRDVEAGLKRGSGDEAAAKQRR